MNRAPGHASIPDPPFRTGGVSVTSPELTADRGVYTLRAGTFLLVLDRIQHKGLDSHGELTAYAIGPGTRDEFARFVVNLLTIRGRKEQANHLRICARDDRSEIPFGDWLDLLFRHAIHAEREGTPAVELATLPKPDRLDEPVWIIHGITVPQHHSANLYGSQGSAKTWIQCSMAVTLASWDVPTIVLDNELSELSSLRRMHLLTGGTLPRGLFYLRLNRSLVHEEDRVHGEIVKHGIQYYFLDSLAPAAGGPLDEESATAIDGVISRFGIGGTRIGHVQKSVADNTAGMEPGGPFGSVFFGNLARQNWFVKREAPDGSSTIRVGLISKKSSFGPDLPPVGLEIRFERSNATTTSVSIHQVDAATVAPAAASLPIWKRMTGELSRGPMTPIALSQALDVSVDSIGRIARAQRNIFVVLPGKKGTQGTIGLLEANHG